MAKNWVAVLSALLVAGACQAGGTGVKDKGAPTAFATVGCTTAPVAPAACSDCGNKCETKCEKCRPCAGKIKDWFCFIPIRTCPCECQHTFSSHPPLYLYFLRPCVEGAGCYHYNDNCSSCVSCKAKPCAPCTPCGGCNGTPRVTHAAPCNTCK